MSGTVSLCLNPEMGDMWGGEEGRCEGGEVRRGGEEGRYEGGEVRRGGVKEGRWGGEV